MKRQLIAWIGAAVILVVMLAAFALLAVQADSPQVKPAVRSDSFNPPTWRR